MTAPILQDWYFFKDDIIIINVLQVHYKHLYMYILCNHSIDTIIIYVQNMIEMNLRPIVNNPETSSQGPNESSPLLNGLRILARLIARDLVAKRSDKGGNAGLAGAVVCLSEISGQPGDG